MCKDFLHANVSAIIYLMNYEQYGRSTASAQYFLQLAGYLGIPVISWNADNSGLERTASQSTMQVREGGRVFFGTERVCQWSFCGINFVIDCETNLMILTA